MPSALKSHILAACSSEPLALKTVGELGCLFAAAVNHLPGNVPEVTGASRAAVLGVLYPR